MSEEAPAAHHRAGWLKRDLLVRLMLPMLLIMATTAVLGVYTAQRLVDRAFDSWLLDAARSVGASVRFDQGRAVVDLPVAAQTVLLYDEVDRVYFSVRQGGRLIVGRRDIPFEGVGESAYANRGKTFAGLLDRQPVRIARFDLPGVGGEGVMILVAETVIKRERTRHELELVLWPMVALVISAAAAILIAVRRTLRPLELIAARWNGSAHTSLQAIGDNDVPRELLPFASALNDLLARIRGILARERQFALTAAHQLRTPLAGLQLGLWRAVETRDPEEARALMVELKQTTQRMARLVQQLLALGRLDPEARLDLDFRVSNLVALVQDIGGAHLDQALGRGIDLELVASVDQVLVRLQPELLSEALGNLIDNAIRYTPRGGRILIELLNHPPRILVSDSGPGIPDNERELVFERFTRGRSALGEGSGLGLAIVRDIASLHGATVSLNVSKLGGLEVTMCFPGYDVDR
ncbi:MAG: sensor histidine kinase [Betaproteobacteria bacterium]|nr:sensor histidine kinase [Betaproteobacteria bacterium]